MRYILSEVYQSPSGDLHEQEVAEFTSKEKVEAFWKKNIEPLKGRHFQYFEHNKIPVDPETFADVDYYNYKECINGD